MHPACYEALLQGGPPPARAVRPSRGLRGVVGAVFWFSLAGLALILLVVVLMAMSG